jgi:FixJ family two-component response regulator
MAEIQSTVFVLDDDASVRGALGMLLEAAGFSVETFESAGELLRRGSPDASGCLVLDVKLPGVSGLDLQGELSASGVHLPVVFITGHGDVRMSVRAMKAGAVEFLTKPFRDRELLEAVEQAIERDRAARRERDEVAELRLRYEHLTPREREVMALLAVGLLNKQVAIELSASESTIKIHRGHVMLKMRADSMADLVRMADRLGLSASRKRSPLAAVVALKS